MREETVQVIESYLDAVRRNDASAAPLHPDVVGEFPTNTYRGAEAFRQALEPFARMVKRIDVLRLVVDGEHGVALLEIETAFGTIPFAEHIHVVNRQIVHVRGYYDPRPILSRASDEPAAPATRGVTVKVLATVDLGPEIEGMAGRQLRMRLVTIEPGGVFGPIHDHKGRPGTVYILQGTITDHRNGVATDYGPGVGWPEDRNTTHWLENRGTIPAVEISVDIVRQE